jgi:hypothetical protein
MVFFLVGGFAGIGIFMPGISIGWAAAGTASAMADAQSRNDSDFRENSSGRMHPRNAAGGARMPKSAAAILAGAGIATAALARRAAAILFGLGVLTIRHFPSPFSIAPIERITV